MGNNQPVSLKDNNRLRILNYVQISAKHNKQIMNKNLKTFPEFSTILKTIYLRATYLKYQWAQWLCLQLQKDQTQIYHDYCEMFKLSLMKRNSSISNFTITNLDKKFMKSLQSQTTKLQKTNFSLFELQTLFEEVKCYFMIQNWFGDLPLQRSLKSQPVSKNSSQKQNQPKEKELCFFNLVSCDTNQTIDNCEKVYKILLKLTEIFFSNNYDGDDAVPNECESPQNNLMKRFTSKEATLIKSIANVPNFKQRQNFIFSLLNSILKFELWQSEKHTFSLVQHKKIYALTRVLGIKNVFCVLKVITQVGSISQIDKIDVVFKHIHQKIVVLRKNQQNENLKEKEALKNKQKNSKTLQNQIV